MDQEEIDRRARRINTDNNVRQKAVRTHAALISFFDGEDLTGVIKSANAETYAAFIAVLTDSGVPGFESRRRNSRQALQRELSDAFRDAGFVGSDGELWVPGRDDYNEIPSSSIGPLLPAMVAILEVEHGIDSTEAVRQYRSTSLETILPDEGEDTASDEVQSQDWAANIRNAPGFDSEAEAYVYVLELERLSDSSTWYYVGKREGQFSDLVTYIRGHASDFTRSRVVTHHGKEILLGNYNASMPLQGTTHRVVDVERIVPISDDEFANFDNPDAESCYISEVERRTSYAVALEYETTNVLGGK